LRANRGDIGFPAPATASDFHPGPRGISSSAVHPTFRRGFILLRAFRLLQRPAACALPFVLRPNLATRPDSRRAPPMGSSSLIATSAVGVHHSAGNPDPAVTFRPRRFSRPRRFPPPTAFAGLFHPAATSRVCPSGVCPSPRSRTGFPRPIRALLPLSADACDQRPRPRLQGFAPRCECGVGRDGLGLDRSAPLVGFSSSGCSLRATWERLRAPSALDLRRQEPLTVGHRRLAIARIGLPGIRLPTRSSFPA
jgi:hypothetical protein